MVRKIKKNGMSLVEVIIGVSIMAVVLISMLFCYNIFLDVGFSNVRNIQATSLAEEGIEVAKLWRDQSWANISNLETGIDYYFNFDGVSKWSTSTAPVIIDSIFQRSFKVSAVYRDTDGKIAGSGTTDVNSRKITVTIAWNAKGELITRSVSAYVMNLFD